MKRCVFSCSVAAGMLIALTVSAVAQTPTLPYALDSCSSFLSLHTVTLVD